MPAIVNLTNEQLDEAIASAVQRHLPITVTIRDKDSWRILHSRFLSVESEHLLIEMPSSDRQSAPELFEAADRIGLSFKLKHYKHICAATIAGTSEITTDDGSKSPVLSLCLPTQMQRVQRRIFSRVSVPANRIVRASFWVGGLDAEPTQASPQMPVWGGQVVDISAGGVQVRCSKEITETLDLGETVGMHISFGLAQETVSIDAQYRHLESGSDTEALIGFQFVGLEQTPKGQEVLGQIGTWMNQFRREANGNHR